MDDNRLIQLAEEYCSDSHEGQFRKGSNLLYETHPLAVAGILDKFGYSDTVTQCVARLHDVVEDANIITGEIKDRFGYEIANGVFILSKNTIYDKTIELLSKSLGMDISGFSIEQLYKMRLSFARKKIKRIKIGDTIHNTEDLASLSVSGIERKISDSREFYIPMGREIAHLMIKELEKNISNYLSSIE